MCTIIVQQQYSSSAGSKLNYARDGGGYIADKKNKNKKITEVS